MRSRQLRLTDNQISKAEFARGGMEPVDEPGGMERVETVEIIEMYLCFRNEIHQLVSPIYSKQ